MVKKMDTFGSTSTKDDKYINAESLIEKIVQDYKNSDERFDLSYYEKPNKKMKDGVFKHIFKEPEKFSDLYYSISGIKIPADSLVNYDLDSEVMFGLENDISFLTNDKSIILLVEQQSTPSPNMPIRCLVYYSNLIRRLCEENKQHHMIEVEVKNIDIHYNSLKAKKEIPTVDYPIDLYGYSFLIDIYDYYKDELKKQKYKKLFSKKLGCSSIDEVNFLLLNNLINRRSLDLAIEATKKKGYLVDYLDREEFRIMLQEKMTLDEFKDIIERRGEARGKVKGEANLIQMMLNNGLSKSQISEATGLSEETIENLLKIVNC